MIMETLLFVRKKKSRGTGLGINNRGVGGGAVQNAPHITTERIKSKKTQEKAEKS